MGINASAGWEQGLKQDNKNTQARGARSENSARARMAANAGSLEDPGEPLVCPQCRAQYDTGLYCVDCDVELVGESFVDSIQPMPRPRDRSNWLIIGLALTAFSVMALGLALTLLT